ncbi:peptide deformylase [Paraoerskovia marina]|uniref:Peptide deformylase n=1 Tax=Paraoerskovia marina TaxID=545619 RepID=A0A1H1V9I2_9CELL|nr:peptide deformylase [Paraoerskovia marina]SDS80909.1 peptide deformylase [Paraoerskovia marina]
MTLLDRLREDVETRLEAAPDGILPIVQAGHPVLRHPAMPYDGQIDDLLPDLLVVMRETMRAAPGVGLAAPQIGISLALAVVEDAGADESDPRERSALPYRVLVNPAYEPTSDEQVAFYEGCLSVRGWSAVRARHRSIRLTGHDETGTNLDEELSGWSARIVQHETDHLNGELYIDRAELRSLADDEAMGRWWGTSPDPAPAAKMLGFDLHRIHSGRPGAGPPAVADRT